MWRFYAPHKVPEMDELCAPRFDPLAKPRNAMPEPEELDLEPLARRDYFTSGGYATGPGRLRPVLPGDIRAPDSNMPLRRWVDGEMSRTGLPAWLAARVLLLAAIAIRNGLDEAQSVLAEDPGVPAELHPAINGILMSIPPMV